MRRRELAPWRLGEFGRWEEAERPFEALRKDMEAFQRNLDRLFVDVLGGTSRHRAMLPEYWATGEMAPRLDETEDDKAFHVDVELPGLDETDVEVTLSDGLLTISGEKKVEPAAEPHMRRRERAYGSFRRTLAVPGDVDADKIKAEFHNGVLTIDLPKTKKAQAKVKRIKVKSA